MASATKSVLFVCMGNICRSPAGECLFREHVEKAGVSGEVEIDSAGTTSYHVGEAPDSRMREAGKKRGIDIVGRGRQFDASDFDRFDLIVAMDRQNLKEIQRKDPAGVHADKVRLLCDFIPDTPHRDVPDPYYGGSQGFETVLDLIEDACPGILEALRDGAPGTE